MEAGRTIGRAPVTRLGFGAASLGNLYHTVFDDEVAATVDAAWNAGVRYFDTAPHYGLGLSERRLGQALRERPRDEWTLSTKVGRLLVAEPAGGGRKDLDHGFDVPATLRRGLLGRRRAEQPGRQLGAPRSRPRRHRAHP